MISWPGRGSTSSFSSAISCAAVAGEESFAQPAQHHRAKLADGRDPALAASSATKQLLFGFRRFEDDADRADAIGDGIDR
jgi:hypothetical protein